MLKENDIEFPPFCGNRLTAKERQMVLEIIRRYKNLTRTELASTLCELLDWTRPNGKLKTVECRQFLESLHQCGILTLPDKQPRKPRKKTVIAKVEVTDNQSLKGSLKDYRPIRLVRVETAEQRSLWKSLIEHHHYLGYRTPFGAHLRYFIEASKPSPQVLGCLQFSSPAWRMAARDQWIGWSDSTRGQHLQRIINNSRFLVKSGVEIKYLASHVLSLAARQVVDDWRACYHIDPLLIETLVDTEKYSGTCYRAANWFEVGTTSGRGRQDREHQRHNAACKRIFLFPLHKNARELLREGE